MRTWIPLAALATACTSLGPVPATTAVSPIPATRGDVDVQAGIAPGYFLSAAVARDPDGAGHAHVGAVFDLGDRAPGLVFGGRAIGESGDTQGEPILGYRRQLDERTAFAVLASGAHGEAEERRASYEATRLHLEASGDIQLTPTNPWIELHAIGGATATYLTATGTYCIDEAGEYGVDCPDEPDPVGPQVDVEVSGVYPAVNAGIALHLRRHDDGAFHGARIYALLTAGGMPEVFAAREEGTQGYVALGLGLSLRFGESR